MFVNVFVVVKQMSTSTCFVCGEEEEFVIRKCFAKSRLLGSPLARKTKEKLDSVSIVNIELLTRTSNISFPIQILPISDLKEKKSLIFEFEGSSSLVSEKNYLPLPDLKSAPSKNPFGLDLLHQDVVEQADRMIRKIVLESSNHSDQAKYLSSLSKYLRVLSYEDLLQIETNILTKTNSQSQESIIRMKDLFYNVLSAVGTNPSVMFIKENIENGILLAEATKPLKDMFRSVKTPTRPLLNELIEFVKNLKWKSNDLHNVALGEMSRLLFRACIHPTRRVTEFPVRIYGEFCSKDENLILRNWIPYLEEELEAVLNGDEPNREQDAVALIYALGQLGHDHVVKTLTKVIGKEFPNTSTLLRSFAVFSFKTLGIVNPSLTKEILLSIADNSEEEDVQVQVAAISTLPWNELTK
jgi:hypothetical protein